MIKKRNVNLTIKNVSGEIHQLIKQRAEQHRRSLNSELLDMLEREVRPRRVDTEALIKSIEEMRKAIPFRLTQKEIQKAKVWGRK